MSGARDALVALAAALVLGILGMHALDLHGMQHMQHMDTPVGMSMTGAGDHSPAESVGSDSYSGGQRGMADMLMLCMAMLAAAAAVLRPRLRGRGVLIRESARRTGSRLPVPAAGAVAGAGPPHVWSFSVIRC